VSAARRALPAAAFAALVILGAACSAVDVPTVRSYRLPSLPGPAAARTPAHVLRVQDLRLAAHVSAEHVMVQDGPYLVRAHPLDVWAGPLDRLVTDVVVAALRRSGGFADVKGSTDVGSEDLWLTATVTDFHYVRLEGGAEAVVGFDVQVRRAADQALVLARELRARASCAETSPSAAVAALGSAVHGLVEDLVAACATLPAQLHGPGPWLPGLAEPAPGRDR
jgi:ABC-type uncharacterized transport system auxiliary subunit